MEQFTEVLWQECVKNQLMNEGWPSFPQVSCRPLPLPIGLDRELEVLVMSLFYPNNLLNSFLFKVDKRTWTSPLCNCLKEEQNALHLLTGCDIVGSDTSDKAMALLRVCNGAFSSTGTHSEPELHNNPFSILNCSRDSRFIELCVEIVENEELNLKRKIKLRKRT